MQPRFKMNSPLSKRFAATGRPLASTNTDFHASTSVGPQISPSAIDYCWERYRNPTPRETSSAPIRKRISRTASCAWQVCRLARWIASAATNTCCGGKRDRFVYAWVVAAPQTSAGPFNLSILVPAARTRRLVRRVQVTTREGQRRARRSLLWRLSDFIRMIRPPFQGHPDTMAAGKTAG